MIRIIFFSIILVIPAGCFFFKEKPSPSNEEVLALSETPPPAPVLEEDSALSAEETPVEEENLQPKEAIKKVEPEIEARTSTLPGGQKLHEVVVLENSLKLTPPNITIRLGDTVRWTNQDQRKHFLASVPGSGKTDELEIFALMDPGKIYEHTFKEAGKYPYFCFIHNQMTGRITVVR